MIPIMASGQAQQDLAKLTQATLDLFKDASTSSQWGTGLGLTNFGLEPVAKLLFPVVTPFRNSLPRKKAPQGATAARWKAIVGYGSSYTRQRPTQPFGRAGSIVTTVEQDFVAPFQLLSLGDSVSLDAQITAAGFDDLRAKAGIKLLYELMVGEDIVALGGQPFALQQPGTPALTFSTTGGTIANAGTQSVNWEVGVACRTLENYWYDNPATATGGQTAIGHATVPVTAAATTGSITGTVAYVPGAVVYDWYADNGLGAGTLYYSQSTTVNKVTITAAASTSGPSITASTADASADANAPAGLLATLVGSYNSSGIVTRGTGGARDSGATFASLDGAQMTANSGTVKEIDNVLNTMWNTYKVSPTRILCNSQEATSITNLTVANSGGISRVIIPDSAQGLTGLTAGQYVDSYVNKAANGQVIKIVVDPQIPPGTLMMVTDVLPFPDTSVDTVLEIETQTDYQQYEYAINRQTGTDGGGPRYDFEVRAIEVVKNYGPAFCGVLENIAAS